MLILYGLTHNKIAGLTSYKDLKIDKEINVEDTLSFLFPVADPKFNLIQEECYIRTEENEYVVKEVNYSDDDWVEYICKINIEELKGTDVSHFETIEQECNDAINLALVGTGWTIGSCDVTKLRTVRKNNCMVYDVLKEIQSAYGCEMTFDSINKEVSIYQSQGSDRGSYFAEQLNLKTLGIQRNSYDFITRLIPLGKDGLGIESVNGGLNYVSNTQYTNKIIVTFWEDNRYTVAQDLKDDAIERLAYLSLPYKSYSASVLDLSTVSIVYGILDYDLGDTITLLAASKSTKEKQRIVKITQYPDESERNTCEIANKLVSLDALQVRFIESTNVVDTVTTVDGLVDGTKLDSIDWSQLQNVHIVIADIQDLSVVTARIGTLETTTAHITNGIIDNATIDIAKVNNLSATYATIINLTATNANITNLTADVADINTLLAGNIGAVNLAAGAIQAGSAVIGTGAIASAQIITLDVSKLNAGNISTNKFTVQSDNGNLKILGDTIKLWDGAGKERVSLGLNGADYNLLIRGADGITVLFGTEGVTHAGITQGAVDDSNVAVNANIDGSKIEKNSLVTQINGATTLLKSSHVIYDPTGQTFEVAFGALKTTVADAGTNLTNNYSTTAQTATLLSSKVTQTQVDTSIDAIQVGGRNLLRRTEDFDVNFWNSDMFWNWIIPKIVVPNFSASPLGPITATKLTGTINSIINNQSQKISCLLDTIYTFSVWIKNIDNVGSVLIGFSTGLNEGLINQLSATKECYLSTSIWQKYTLTYRTPTSGINKLEAIIYYLENAKSILVWGAKLEVGNKATDWTPAPEDVQGQIDATNTNISTNYSTTTQTAINYNIAVGAVSTNLSNNYSTTTAMNSAIDISKNAINLSVSQTYATIANLGTTNGNVSTLAGRVSTAELKITPAAIILTVASTYTTPAQVDTSIGAIQIGGRNYILDSANRMTTGLESHTEYKALDVGQSYMNIPNGTNVVLSFDLEMTVNSAGPSLYVYNSNILGPKNIGGGSPYLVGVVGSTIKGRYSFNTTIWDRTPSIMYNVIEFYSQYGTANWFKITNLKVEIGNKATDWTPAPEDIPTKANIISTINISPEAIGISASKITISGAVTLSNWSHGSDVTKIDGGDIYTESITATQIAAGAITANKIAANAIVIGGRNLLQNTSGLINTDHWTGSGNHVISVGLVSLNITASGGGNASNCAMQSLVIPIVNGQEYTISFDVGSYTGGESLHCELWGGVDMFNTTCIAGWIHVSHKLTGSSQTQPLYFWLTATGSVYINNIKLEIGNRATAWSPAIEDMASQKNLITAGETTINGGNVTTGIIQSVDGKTYFNLNTSEIKQTTTIGGKTIIVTINPTKCIEITSNGAAMFGVSSDGYTYVNRLYDPDDPTAYVQVGKIDASTSMFTMYRQTGGAYTAFRKRLQIMSYGPTATTIECPVRGAIDTDGSAVFVISHGDAELWLWGDSAGGGTTILQCGDAEVRTNSNGGPEMLFTGGSIGVDATGSYKEKNMDKVYFDTLMSGTTDLNNLKGVAFDGYKGFTWSAANAPGYGFLEILYYHGGNFAPRSGAQRVTMQRWTSYDGTQQSVRCYHDDDGTDYWDAWSTYR